MTLLWAIIITVALFSLLATALVIAERHLVNYGDCQVLLNNGEQRFSVPGGGNLLTTLADKGISIPASCGGKGMCGFCKVRVVAGGGELLPTEKPFLSRREIAAGTRLACQVRLRQDIEVVVPDFLDVVAEMVRNGTFDKNAKWRFTIQGEENEPF